MLPAAQIVNFERNISAISRRYRKEWRLSNEVVLDDAVAQVVRRRGLEDWDEMQLFLLAEVRQNGCWAIADCLVEKDSESDSGDLKSGLVWISNGRKEVLSTSSLIWPSYTIRATIFVFWLGKFPKTEYFSTKREFSDTSPNRSGETFQSEIGTSLDFKWLKRGWVANGLVFEWDLKYGSPTIWNLDWWPPFCQKPFEIRTKLSRFWMVRFSDPNCMRKRVAEFNKKKYYSYNLNTVGGWNTKHA